MSVVSSVSRMAKSAMMAGAVLASSAVVAQAQSFFYAGGPVTVKYLGASAGDISTLFYKVGGAYNVGGYTSLFTNDGTTAANTQTVLTIASGTAIGTEIFFRLDNSSNASVNCPCSWYSGGSTNTGAAPGTPGTNARNADGKTHIAVLAGSGLAALGGGNYTTAFNYEDRYIPPADADYNDLNFEIAGVTTTPEPSSIALMATGILALGVAARRRRRV